MEKKDLTAADVWAMFAETDRKIAEGHRILDEKLAENNRYLTEQLAETKKLFEDLGLKFDDVKTNVNGISDSNGEFAEEYFFSSLKRRMEFAGVHFDDIDKDFKRLKKLPNGERIKDQFDIVMINDNAVALIEVKYTARKNYPTTMVNQKVPNFRILFPDYANYKIYLGLGALSISEEVAKEAKELGIGLLRQVGETVEYETNWVKAY
jgi:hypothetical protein